MNEEQTHENCKHWEEDAPKHASERDLIYCEEYDECLDPGKCSNCKYWEEV